MIVSWLRLQDVGEAELRSFVSRFLAGELEPVGSKRSGGKKRARRERQAQPTSGVPSPAPAPAGTGGIPSPAPAPAGIPSPAPMPKEL